MILSIIVYLNIFRYYGNIQYLRLISTFFAIITLLLIDKFELDGPFSYIAIFFSNMCWWIMFNITYIVRVLDI